MVERSKTILHKSKGNGQTKLGIGILEDMKNEKLNLNLIETRPKVFGSLDQDQALPSN